MTLLLTRLYKFLFSPHADIRERFYYIVLVSIVTLRNLTEFNWNLGKQLHTVTCNFIRLMVGTYWGRTCCGHVKRREPPSSVRIERKLQGKYAEFHPTCCGHKRFSRQVNFFVRTDVSREEKWRCNMSRFIYMQDYIL